ncbi:MAG: mechanosensitive ion channel [Alphaproteobacteria bacterium]|nr:mechanosensitive ion channel [Alphaproteobacteria bacterium]
MEGVDIQQFIQFINFDGIPFAMFVLVIGFLALRVVSSLVDDLGERFTNWRLQLMKGKAMLRFAAYIIIAVLVASTVLRLESEALLAISGTIAVAIGFAMKDLAASLMAGLILLVDEPFQVGDRIAFDGYYGEVTEIGLRSVRLATLDDNAVTVPNSKFLTDSVASANAGALDAMVVVPFYIAAAEDFQRARRIVTEATATSRYVYLSKPVVTLVTDQFLGERFVTVITTKAYVFDIRYEKAFVTDITERVKLAFRRAGIRTPDQQYRDLDINAREEPHPAEPTKVGPHYEG